MIDVPTRVKDALREGDRLKEYRFVVRTADDTADDFTIDNDYLVAESVSFDERMCSDKEIKFGLCEGTSLEFQYFDKDNITGRRLKAFVDVQYKDSDNTLKWHTIPMGWFTVDACSRQASTGIIKVTAYNKLQSDYLDNKANERVQELAAAGESGYVDQITMHTLLGDMLEDYAIVQEQREAAEHLTGQFSSISVEYNIQMCDSHTHQPISLYLWVWVDLVEIVGPSYQSDEFYEIRMDLKKFEDYISTVIPSAIGAHWYDDLWVADDGGYCSLSTFIERYYSDKTLSPSKRPWCGALGFSGGILGMDKDTPSTVYSPFEYFANQYIRYQSEPFYRHWEEAKTSESIPFNSKPVIGLFEPNYGHDYDGFCLVVPRVIAIGSSSTTRPYNIPPRIVDVITEFDITVDHVVVSEIEKFTVSSSSFTSDVTLRDLQSAVFEIDCQYGQLDRTTDLFSGVELNGSRLLPADDLYPSNTLYPNGTSESSFPSMYSKLWADEGNVRKFRYLIITYKGLDENNQEVEKVLQRTVNADGTDDYNMSDNWLFKNLVWSDNDVGDYADAMVLKMQNLTWFPFEMWCAGLPYIETGDELEISIGGTAYTSYVLRRTLKGIQNLQDEMINGTLDIF